MTAQLVTAARGDGDLVMAIWRPGKPDALLHLRPLRRDRPQPWAAARALRNAAKSAPGEPAVCSCSANSCGEAPEG